MKKISLLAFAFILSFVSCKDKKKEENIVVEEEVFIEKIVDTKTVTVKLEPKSDSKVTGEVVFTEVDGTIAMVAKLSGLEQGTHAIHIHESSDCSSPDGKSTGGHWNPTNQPHGAWGAESGYHKGDIGNVIADENGNAELTFSTNEWCIGCEDDTKNILGKAIIVHAGEDDLTTQPTGAAGGRVSCGGIIE
ncbi:MAG: superoxide dismutase family protein [Aestuariibaculum sp.]